MKWFTHQLVGVTAAMSIHMPTTVVCCVVFGAILPDVIDQKIAAATTRPQRTFRRIHRGASHWFGWYLILFLIGIWGSPEDLATFFDNEKMQYILLYVFLGIGFGGLSHILLDMLTPMGVPYAPFFLQKRFSLHICATGSLCEYILLAIYLLCFFMHSL